MRPGEVLDAQGDLMERLGHPKFEATIDNLGGFEFGRSGGRGAFHPESSTPLSTMLRTLLPAAHTYRVTHDMSLLVEHAAAGLDDLDQFDSSLAPTGCGFVAFDRPIPLIDARGKTMLIHYLAWGPTMVQFANASDAIGVLRGARSTATMVVEFNDIWRQPDEVQGELFDSLRETLAEGTPNLTPKQIQQRLDDYQQYMGRWATVGAAAYLDGQRLGPAKIMPSEEHQAKLLADGFTPHEGTNPVRILHALWLLMEQTVARVETEHPDRPSRRRAAKRRLPPAVTVIRLRREAGGERAEGESLVEWAHRWVVRGHWRWQAVSEHHPLAQEIEPGKFRARIWINPYVKGGDHLVRDRREPGR